MKDACTSSDQVHPSAPSSHRTKKRCRGAIPQTYLEPRGIADGVPVQELGLTRLLASLPALPGVGWYFLSCGLMPEVQPHSETGQSTPGRISLLFLTRFEPNIGLLHEQGVCVPEAVSLRLVRNSRGRVQETGAWLEATALAGPSGFGAAQATLWPDRRGWDAEGMRQGSGKGGTPWRAIPPWDAAAGSTSMPFGQLADPLVRKRHGSQAGYL